MAILSGGPKEAIAQILATRQMGAGSPLARYAVGQGGQVGEQGLPGQPGWDRMEPSAPPPALGQGSAPNMLGAGPAAPNMQPPGAPPMPPPQGMPTGGPPQVPPGGPQGPAMPPGGMPPGAARPPGVPPVPGVPPIPSANPAMANPQAMGALANLAAQYGG